MSFLAVLGVISGLIILIEASEKKKAAEEEREKAAIEAAEEQRKKAERQTNADLAQREPLFWNAFFAHRLFIDSNIWMDDEQKYDVFFSMFNKKCAEFGRMIEMSAMQYDEICRLKEDGAKARNARLAQKRIEGFVDSGCLRIHDLGVQEKRHSDYTYTDGYLVWSAEQCAKKGEKCIIITNDRDLRIRAKHRAPSGSVIIFGLESVTFDGLDTDVRHDDAYNLFAGLSKAYTPET